MYKQPGNKEMDVTNREGKFRKRQPVSGVEMTSYWLHCALYTLYETDSGQRWGKHIEWTRGSLKEAKVCRVLRKKAAMGYHQLYIMTLFCAYILLMQHIREGSLSKYPPVTQPLSRTHTEIQSVTTVTQSPPLSLPANRCNFPSSTLGQTTEQQISEY